MKRPTERPPFSGEGPPIASERDTAAGRGQSEGVPARGELADGSFSPTGGPGVLHWQQGTITRPGLDDRGDVFFAAIEMTRMPMILTDPNVPDNPVVFANRAFQDLTGYTEDEIVGRNCRFLQGAHTSREAVRELREAVAERRAISMEILNYKRDGTPFWNAVFIGPVYDRDGGLLYFFASQLDVTRRRSSEQAFRQAQKMESIGQLTAGLAHDFNNLLQIVQGNLEVLGENSTLGEVDRRALASALHAVDRGARLTRQLLAFARKTRLEPRPTNLNAAFVEMGDMLETAIGPGIDLRLELKPRLPTCLLDTAHLEMALLNVLINARDAMPGGGSIRVSTSQLVLNGEAEARELSPGTYVVLEIRDEGAGMPPQVLERATEPFFTTKEVGKGTGLGLAMVQGFVQQSRGRLELESEPGRGTVVRMIFPTATEAERLAAHEPPAPPASPRREEESGGAETILVVEDNDDVLELAHGHLSKLGYRVLTARSGEEAIAAFESADGRVDLLFTDLVMPGGINGLVLAERLRERSPALPVLLTTGYNEELVADGPRAPGMDVLGKPYQRSDLADRVRAALNRAGVGEAPRRAPRQPHSSAEG